MSLSERIYQRIGHTDTCRSHRTGDCDCDREELRAAVRAFLHEAKPIEHDGKTRYLWGPFEDPADGPRVLMSAHVALCDLWSRYEEGEVGDELTYQVVELTDAEVEALPEC